MSVTRIVTLNEIIQLFEDFVSAHGQLTDFGYGPASDIGTSKQMTFPYMWVSHQSDSYIRVSNKTAIPELKLLLFFMDQNNDQVNFEDTNGENSTNGQEIMSDTLQMLQDCISYISANWGVSGIMISEDVRIFPGFDETQDSVNGWVGEITLKLSHINCTIPS